MPTTTSPLTTPRSGFVQHSFTSYRESGRILFLLIADSGCFKFAGVRAFLILAYFYRVSAGCPLDFRPGARPAGDNAARRSFIGLRTSVSKWPKESIASLRKQNLDLMFSDSQLPGSPSKWQTLLRIWIRDMRRPAITTKRRHVLQLPGGAV
jgi:hypothetical protein